jgi:hypothetical protein
VTVAVACATPEFARAGSYRAVDTDGAGCGLFAPSATPGYSATCGAVMTIAQTGLTVPAGSEENLTAHAPSGLLITGATGSFSTVDVGADGWGGGDFYTGGSGGNPWAGTSSFTDAPAFSSDHWGFQLTCGGGASCTRPVGGNPPTAGPFASVSVSTVTLTVFETQGPSVSAAGPNNLFNQTSGYAWNPAGDPWSIATAASDVSGVCTVVPSVNNQQLAPIAQFGHDESQWQQCPNQTSPGQLDTRQFVGTAGPLTLTLTATNAAGNSTPITHTIQVDNDPVQESLSIPNDPNPTLWVNHAVTVQSAASAGPSGISGTNCIVDGGKSSAYPDGGLTVDGDGAHTASCTASNGAVDPQGDHNTGSATQTIKIDEAPPAIGFEPVNPDDPTAVVVDTSDAESGVAGGSITVQGPHAKQARSLSTALDGADLVSRFNDAGKHGVYTFVATSCDAVGNCSSATEALRVPIRLGSRSFISFHRIKAPATVIHRRVRVGFRTKTVTRHRHGRRIHRMIKIGGHFRRVKIRVNPTTGCGTDKIKVRRKDFEDVRACRKLAPHVVTRDRQHLGHRVALHGLLTTKQGRPLAHRRVVIAARNDDRGARFKRVLITRTDKDGIWKAKLPGGPSRTVRARYRGSHVIEPATSLAQLAVPAEIKLKISPHVLPWSHAIRIRGHLVGRFVPHDGVALRFLVRYPHAKQRTALQALRTNRHGAFSFTWNYHAGRGVATYPFSVATTATETDYPYAAGASRPVRVTFGRRTPRHRHRHHPHRHR